MRVLAAIAAAWLASPASAQSQECARVENDLDRLACYDKQSGRTPIQTTAQSSGEWRLYTETSKITDEKTVTLDVQSKEVIECGWNRKEKITLTLRCMENITSLIFNTGCHMTSSEYNSYGDVTYRIDDRPAKTRGMLESTDHKALGLWTGGSSIPMIKELFGAKQLIARMTPYSENQFTATFNVSGLDQAIQPIRESCKW